MASIDRLTSSMPDEDKTSFFSLQTPAGCCPDDAYYAPSQGLHDQSRGGESVRDSDD